MIEEIGNEIALVDFFPRFARLKPPMLSIEDDELFEIDPEALHEIIWDPGVGQTAKRGSELKELMLKASKKSLQPQKEAQALQILDQDPKVVHCCGMTPDKLPSLVAVNRRIAKAL